MTTLPKPLRRPRLTAHKAYLGICGRMGEEDLAKQLACESCRQPARVYWAVVRQQDVPEGMEAFLALARTGVPLCTACGEREAELWGAPVSTTVQ